MRLEPANEGCDGYKESSLRSPETTPATGPGARLRFGWCRSFASPPAGPYDAEAGVTLIRVTTRRPTQRHVCELPPEKPTENGTTSHVEKRKENGKSRTWDLQLQDRRSESCTHFAWSCLPSHGCRINLAHTEASVALISS